MSVINPAESRPLVSVVITVYNGEQYIDKTLTTIRTQSYQNLEIIIVNDGSIDSSQKILERHSSEDKRIRIFNIENRGVAGARNYGIEQSTGNFVGFCDHDDLWDPEKLTKQMPLFKKPDIGVVYCGAENKYTNLDITRRPRHSYKPRGHIFDTLILGNVVTCCSAVVRKDCLVSAGLFDTDKNLMGVDDWHLWIKLSLITQYEYVNEYLCTHVFHGDNYSLNDDLMHKAEIICIEKIMNNHAFEMKDIDLRMIKRKIHLRYTKSYINSGMFKTAADSFYMANQEYYKLSTQVKAWVYKYLPDTLLGMLQLIKRKLHSKSR